MTFAVAVVFFSAHGLLVTLANIIAEGARKVVLLLLTLPSANLSSPAGGPLQINCHIR